MEEKTTKIYSYKELLILFLNDWNEKLIARTIDLVHDNETLKRDGEDAKVLSVDPMTGQYKQVSVVERINSKKVAMQDALDIISAIKKILSDIENIDFTEADFEQKYFSLESLKIEDKAEIVSPLQGEDITNSEE